MTEIQPIPCHIGKRQPLIVQPMAGQMPIAITVYFELDHEHYGDWPAWTMTADVEWQLDIRTVRRGFAVAAVLPSLFLAQGADGTAASYDDPPVSGTWIPLPA